MKCLKLGSLGLKFALEENKIFGFFFFLHQITAAVRLPDGNV